jgi:hypothetical protein
MAVVCLARTIAFTELAESEQTPDNEDNARGPHGQRAAGDEANDQKEQKGETRCEKWTRDQDFVPFWQH